MKLWIVNVDTRTNVLLKFGNLETVCVDGRSKNLFNLPHYRYMSNLGLCTHFHTINFSILCCLVMKLWIVNVDTKAKVLLKFGSLETLCVDMTLKKKQLLQSLQCLWILGVERHSNSDILLQITYIFY